MPLAAVYANTQIAAVVLPLKVAAEDRAEQEARAVIAKVQAELEAADWNLEQVAPWPHRMSSWDRRFAPMRDKAKLYGYFVTHRKSSRSMNETTDFVDMSQKHCDMFVADARRNAADQYDSFVVKLIGKIGETTSANLKGNHVWGFSFLTVVTKSGETQIWKTQMIVNVSKYNKLFNQFPSRKVKAAC